MKKRLKTAIIGCGLISRVHIPAIIESGVADICAVCDTDEKNLSEVMKLCPGAVGFTDYKEMLTKADIDVVHICTPHYLHHEMAIASMERGCDVYLEKPCAMNTSLAEEIINASDLCGKKVCVSFQNRLVNTTIQAKKIIDSGEMGKVVGAKAIVTWNRHGEYYTKSPWRGKFATEGGGVLINQSIHTLDLMYYLVGEVDFVKGHAATFENYDIIEVEDTATAFIKFKNGASGIFYATNCNVVDSPIELELYFEKGSLLIKNDTLYKCVDGNMTEVCKNETLLNGKPYWGNGHLRMIGAFYKSLLGENTYYCDIKDSVQVLEMIAGIYKNSEVSPDKIK